jgi:hypothetical protein
LLKEGISMKSKNKWNSIMVIFLSIYAIHAADEEGDKFGRLTVINCSGLGAEGPSYTVQIRFHTLLSKLSGNSFGAFIENWLDRMVQACTDAFSDYGIVKNDSKKLTFIKNSQVIESNRYYKFWFTNSTAHNKVFGLIKGAKIKLYDDCEFGKHYEYQITGPGIEAMPWTHYRSGDIVQIYPDVGNVCNCPSEYKEIGCGSSEYVKNKNIYLKDPKKYKGPKYICCGSDRNKPLEGFCCSPVASVSSDGNIKTCLSTDALPAAEFKYHYQKLDSFNPRCQVSEQD